MRDDFYVHIPYTKLLENKEAEKISNDLVKQAITKQIASLVKEIYDLHKQYNKYASLFDIKMWRVDGRLYFRFYNDYLSGDKDRPIFFSWDVEEEDD